MLIVDQGKLEKKYRDGRTLYLKSGDTSGSLHFFNKDVSSSTLKAAEDSVVYVLKTDDFVSACAQDQDLNSQFIHFLSLEVRKRSNILSNIRFQMDRRNKRSISFFDTKPYTQESFQKYMKSHNVDYQFHWYKEKMGPSTASFAAGCDIVCCFVNDTLTAEAIKILKDVGVSMIAMCCAGYDNVDLKACEEQGISVTRVPAYSPNAVAEFAITLILTCNRNVHKSYNRVRDFNFSLAGLVGFDMYGKTVGIFGTGKIGAITAKILRAFGCTVLCYDVHKNAELEAMEGIKYVEIDELFSKSDIISLHAPLVPSTKYIINKDSISNMKKGVIIVNTSRGGLINSQDLLDAIMSGHIGSVGLDVYEGEKQYFFEDRSSQPIVDSVLSQLIACHNVIVTSHQAFLTTEALYGITESVMKSIGEFYEGKRGSQLTNIVRQEFK